LLCLGAAAGALYRVVQQLRQTTAEVDSLCICEDNGIGAWRTILQQYADEHNGSLPDVAQRQHLAQQYKQSSSHFQLTCNTGAPYQWDNAIRHVDKQHLRPVLWCGKPHGVTRLWRNVLYSDLQVRRRAQGRAEANRAAAAH